jgi:hypothetical protein
MGRAMTLELYSVVVGVALGLSCGYTVGVVTTARRWRVMAERIAGEWQKVAEEAAEVARKAVRG